MFIKGMIAGTGFQQGLFTREYNNLLDKLITENLVFPVSIWI